MKQCPLAELMQSKETVEAVRSTILAKSRHALTFGGDDDPNKYFMARTNDGQGGGVHGMHSYHGVPCHACEDGKCYINSAYAPPSCVAFKEYYDKYLSKQK
jgi:hypothetical protein